MSETTTAVRPFAKGDKVIVNPADAPRGVAGVVYVVDRINPKNIIARPVGSVVRKGINYPKDLLRHYDGEVTDYGTVAGGISVPIPEFFDIGQVVTFKTPPAGATTETPFVVIAQKDRVNVTRLGGDGGRYWRAAPSGLVKRDLAWVAESLVAAL